MRTVKEISQLTGVIVRTLHHYDSIGLLKPTRTTDAGYRLYDKMPWNDFLQFCCIGSWIFR